jgi:DNA-binding SARP family transcriptional activator
MDMIRFRILGALEMDTPEGVVRPRGPKVRKVLALLLLRRNQTVEIDALIDELWDEAPPRSAITTVRTHIYHLRGMLTRMIGERRTEELLVTQPSGYLLRVGPEQVDAEVFTKSVANARTLAREGRLSEASSRLRNALGMWRGRVLSDVGHGMVVTQHVGQLEELRIRALELRVDTAMELGQHRELVAELRGLVAANPFNEWFHVRLIDALRLSGRRAEALDALRDLRRLLNEELGLEPSTEAQELQQEILAAPRSA